MRMNIGLNQVLAQKQILSPQMIQSMEILVLNSQQLEERIDRELEENVALEMTDSSDDEDGGAKADGADWAGSLAPTAPEIEVSTQEIDLLRDRYEHLAEFQAQERYNSPGPRMASGDHADDKFEALNNTAGRPQSLQEHLLEQLRLKSDLVRFSTNGVTEQLVEEGGHEVSENGETPAESKADERLRQICSELVYNLDVQGRLRYGLDEIFVSLNKSPRIPAVEDGILGMGAPIELPVAMEEIETALRIIQSLDPAGVGAVGTGIEGIKHCLLLQLERDPGDYPLEKQLIEFHLEDISKNRLPQIAKSTGKSLEEIKDAVEIIQSLDPLPGKEFEDGQNAYVRPDVLVEEVDGQYRVVVEETATPRIRISSYYRELLEQSRKDPEIRKYIKSKIDNAEWLLQAIQQRKSTLQRVAEEVVVHQQEFFHKGVRGLKPLKMQDIADKIGVNVSTVSRAISGKSFQAPGCIKELKFLFTGGTTRDDGSTESRDSVIMRIKDLIADEDPKKPLSDARIVELLKKEGIHISRRTVTKYREAEGMPSSRERRQF